jgi:hypothetical protein
VCSIQWTNPATAQPSVLLPSHGQALAGKNVALEHECEIVPREHNGMPAADRAHGFALGHSLGEPMPLRMRIFRQGTGAGAQILAGQQ